MFLSNSDTLLFKLISSGREWDSAPSGIHLDFSIVVHKGDRNTWSTDIVKPYWLNAADIQDYRIISWVIIKGHGGKSKGKERWRGGWGIRIRENQKIVLIETVWGRWVKRIGKSQSEIVQKRKRKKGKKHIFFLSSLD